MNGARTAATGSLIGGPVPQEAARRSVETPVQPSAGVGNR